MSDDTDETHHDVEIIRTQKVVRTVTSRVLMSESQLCYQ